MSTGLILGPFFPSNDNVAQFSLQLLPLDENIKRAEYIQFSFV